ncbi:ribose-5-phosphate isomerase RpiA [Virgibacillus sp. 179-BFC.A HS]|uniref:Ribose-5-phosphate isomerase A n=1 Tax=Tigheibacillus jepli TaxID=3035914 RepID=A0ABU5CFC5_9BACI|nr:ribose-5-phosphate isomerase RpiA [Virgibacillus sp. 179-BFC.A HS]MDY0404915.1 ribose-5-phosphate isomerase RpiA [Virgibacillus sp. 179-BFC.A HS]
MDQVNQLKKAVGDKAAEFVESGMTLGLGSGSTVYYFLKKLAEFVKDGMKIQGVPTSFQTAAWAKKFGIPLTHLASGKRVDLAVDGADEIDPHFNLIKGGGGCLLREKIVAANAKCLIIIADETKQVATLGKFGLPVEVVPFGSEIIADYIRDLGGTAKMRTLENGDPFVSDNGNYLFDCDFGLIDDPGQLHNELKSLVGVVETGLFIQMTDTILIGKENEVKVLKK